MGHTNKVRAVTRELFCSTCEPYVLPFLQESKSRSVKCSAGCYELRRMNTRLRSQAKKKAAITSYIHSLYAMHCSSLANDASIHAGTKTIRLRRNSFVIGSFIRKSSFVLAPTSVRAHSRSFLHSFCKARPFLPMWLIAVRQQTTAHVSLRLRVVEHTRSLSPSHCFYFSSRPHIASFAASLIFQCV
ncbi:hypothetical protein BC939DRAFT_129454 [Gamsiella multidivaricata]|uniref:uncharacterized protein n=1 Tax=Gamsiella multidivaricata TaxID=101098 RepID=UPI00221F9802|nr:uncharacterized protein BC939DRAFT_129454 [Gamsiella multidivaricata]KAI7825383.1 hypothetical protein BC939DRAFT_129454 [Gamsiella multidivaricata]